MAAYWCRYYREDNKVAGRTYDDLKVISINPEMAAIKFWSLNMRNHRLPVRVVVVDEVRYRVVEVAKVVGGNLIQDLPIPP